MDFFYYRPFVLDKVIYYVYLLECTTVRHCVYYSRYTYMYIYNIHALADYRVRFKYSIYFFISIELHIPVSIC